MDERTGQARLTSHLRAGASFFRGLCYRTTPSDRRPAVHDGGDRDHFGGTGQIIIEPFRQESQIAATPDARRPAAPRADFCIKRLSIDATARRRFYRGQPWGGVGLCHHCLPAASLILPVRLHPTRIVIACLTQRPVSTHLPKLSVHTCAQTIQNHRRSTGSHSTSRHSLQRGQVMGVPVCDAWSLRASTPSYRPPHSRTPRERW
jgi:hypothetical protein